jgi:glutaredoxin
MRGDTLGLQQAACIPQESNPFARIATGSLKSNLAEHNLKAHHALENSYNYQQQQLFIQNPYLFLG